MALRRDSDDVAKYQALKYELWLVTKEIERLTRREFNRDLERLLRRVKSLEEDIATLKANSPLRLK